MRNLGLITGFLLTLWACDAPISEETTPICELVSLGPPGALPVRGGFEVELRRSERTEWHWVTELPQSFPGLLQLQQGDSALDAHGAFRVEAVLGRELWPHTRLPETLQGRYPNARYIQGCVDLSAPDASLLWRRLPQQDELVYGLWPIESGASLSWEADDQVALEFLVWALRGPDAVAEALRYVNLGLLPENTNTTPSRMDFEWGMSDQVLPEVHEVLSQWAPQMGHTGRAALLFSEPQPMVMALAFRRSPSSVSE